jgi:hypothetical protein
MTRRPTSCRAPSRCRGKLTDASGRCWHHPDARYLRRWVSGQNHLLHLRTVLGKSQAGARPFA